MREAVGFPGGLQKHETRVGASRIKPGASPLPLFVYLLYYFLILFAIMLYFCFSYFLLSNKIP